MDSDKGREVKAHYLAVGRRMRAYSASLHKQWFETVDAQLIALLRRTLLVVPFTIQQHGSGAVPAADVSGQTLYNNDTTTTTTNNDDWWRSIVVKTAGSAGVLSLSCT